MSESHKPKLPLDIEFLLEGILNEDPDSVADTTGHRFTDWRQGIPFLAFKTFSIIGNPERPIVHYEMFQWMGEMYYENPEAQWKYKSGQIKVSNLVELKRELDKSYVKKFVMKYFRKVGMHKLRTRFCLCGRAWVEDKVISFWNSQEDVLNQWDRIEKMFNDFESDFGNLNEYNVDWIEREKRFAGNSFPPLTPAKTVTSSSGKYKKYSADETQGNFLTQLFGTIQRMDHLTPEQMKKVQMKVHTLPPEQKKIALDAMGAKNVKAAEIADKIGMSVVQFNHLMHQGVAEGKYDDEFPKMADIAKELSGK